tara:strand:+ start:204 stop:437 length:234 start_codon:yes stop_codon:yes gene_type:complete
MSTHANNPKIPDAFPICDTLLRSLDIEVYKKNNICSDCELHFLQQNRKDWDEGWRPNDQQIAERMRKREIEPFFYRN